MKKNILKTGLAVATLAAVIAVLPADVTPVANGSITAQAAVKLSKKKATLTVGKKLTLKVKGTKKKVKWSSSNKKVATVSKKGVVEAKKAGKTKITAKVGSKRYSCKITVNAGATQTQSTKPTEPVNRKAEPWMEEYLSMVKSIATNAGTGKTVPSKILLTDLDQDGIPELFVYCAPYGIPLIEQTKRYTGTGNEKAYWANNNLVLPRDAYLIDLSTKDFYMRIGSTLSKINPRSSWSSSPVFSIAYTNSEPTSYGYLDGENYVKVTAEEYEQRLQAYTASFTNVLDLMKDFTAYNRAANEIDWDQYWLK